MAAARPNCGWRPKGSTPTARRKGARVFYVDIATQSGQQMNAYLAERKITPGGHAGVSETAQVVALDRDARHIRRDRYAASAAGPEPAAGVLVDPTPATAEMGTDLPGLQGGERRGTDQEARGGRSRARRGRRLGPAGAESHDHVAWRGRSH